MDVPEPSFLRQLRETFRVEAAEHVQAISAGLLALEQAGEGGQRELVETVFREAHSLKGAARAVDYLEIERLCQSLEDVFARWRRGDEQPVAATVDRLQATLDAIAAALGAIETPPAGPVTAASKPSGHAMPAGVPAPPGPAEPAPTATVRVALDKLQARLIQAEEMLSAKLIATQRAADVRELCGSLAGWQDAWNAVEPQLWQLRRKGTEAAPAGMDKLLEFLEWNAECVKAASARAGALERRLRQDRHVVGKLVDDLLEDSKSLLLLPFSSITGSFARLVRDLCREQGKQATLLMTGDNVELDKRILEEIKDPLVHLLRNAVDHGVEPPALRERGGKPAAATLTLAVSQLGGNKVEIAVCDDGAGIDAAAVARAAVERGLLTAQEAAGIGEEAARALVFAADLSTRAAVSHVSGRGLGLAIVREKAEKLGGTVSVASEAGRGTAFRIIVPAMQATFRGILVMAAGELMVLPTLHVERVRRVRAEQVRSAEGREFIALEGRPVALVRLAEVLELPAVRPAESSGSLLVLVLGAAELRVGFVVDSVLDEQEVLVKQLGRPLVRVRNVSGATVLGSGRVAPVLNVADLLKSARKSGAVLRFALPEPAPRKGSILLAEDSITSRLLLKGILEGAGYRVRTAADGLEALDLLHREKFDVLISDVEMPGLNGFDLTARVRGEQALAALPVVLVTALEGPEDRQRGLQAGAQAYLAKSSFDQSDLLATLGRLL